MEGGGRGRERERLEKREEEMGRDREREGGGRERKRENLTRTLDAIIHKFNAKEYKGVNPAITSLGERLLHAPTSGRRGGTHLLLSSFHFCTKENCRNLSICLRCHPQAESTVKHDLRSRKGILGRVGTG